jgi:TIR domain
MLGSVSIGDYVYQGVLTMVVNAIFISHATEDHEIATKVRECLERDGIKVWIAPEDITPDSSNFTVAIRTAISNADAIILIATGNSCTSPYVLHELELAQRYTRSICPLWADGEEWVDVIPFGFVHLQHYDIRGKSFETGMQSVIDQFSSDLGPDARGLTVDANFRRRLQHQQRQRIFHQFRDSVKETWGDKTLNLSQKLPKMLDAGSIYVANMSEFEKRWGDLLLPAEDSPAKNLLMILANLESAVRNESSSVLAKSAALIKHTAQLITELEKHWVADTEDAVEGSVAQSALPSGGDEKDSSSG